MKTWFGSYFISLQAEPVEATVLVYDKAIAIGFRLADGTNSTTTWNIDDIAVSFDNSLQATKLSDVAKPGAKLIIDGKEAKEFIEQLQEEYRKPWHQKEKTRDRAKGLIVFLGVIAVLISVYILAVPWLSEKLASTVSVKTEEQFGNAVYDALDLSSQEDKAATMVVNDFFDAMKVTTGYNVRITVVNSDIVNAFALPGGHIVIYTGLLKEIKTYPELVALLSHEFTHVNNKHSTKSIFRQLGSRIFLSLLFGEFGSVTSVMIDQADQFRSLKYSRKLEKEADMEGLAILKQRKIDPEGFVLLFKHLKNAVPASAMPEFLGSHPDIDNRVAYIREASKNAVVEDNAQLNAIFEQIK